MVSVEDNRIPTLPPPNGFAGRVTTGYSSVDNGRNGAATIDAAGPSVAFHADGFKTAADSYDTPLGIQRNSANESQGGADNSTLRPPSKAGGGGRWLRWWWWSS